jgi:hypothetical protein
MAAEQINQLWEELWELPQSEAFRNPVDSSQLPTHPPYLRIIQPYSPLSLKEVSQRRAAGAYHSFAELLNAIRTVFVIAVRYWRGGYRVPALQCLVLLDRLMSDSDALRGAYRATQRREYVTIAHSFPKAWEATSALEEFIAVNIAPLEAFFYPFDTYYPVNDAPIDYDRYIKRRISLSDVSERVYTGQYDTLDKFKADVCLVFDNAITYFAGSDDGIVKQAQVLKAAWLDMLAMHLEGRAGKRKRAADSKAAGGAGSVEAGGGGGGGGAEAAAAPVRDDTLPVGTYIMGPRPPAPMKAEWHDKCASVLARVMAYERSTAVGLQVKPASFFVDPVDTAVFPDYTTVIRNPMWLRKVQQRLQRGEYAAPQDVWADVRLTIDNCLQYNPDTPDNADIRWCAKETWDRFALLYVDALRASDGLLHGITRPRITYISPNDRTRVRPCGGVCAHRHASRSHSHVDPHLLPAAALPVAARRGTWTRRRCATVASGCGTSLPVPLVAQVQAVVVVVAAAVVVAVP